MTHGDRFRRGHRCSTSVAPVARSSTRSAWRSGRRRYLHGVAAELLAQRREQALGERVVLARSEAREQRGRQHRQRHGALDRLPAASSAPRPNPRRSPSASTESGSSASARAVSSSSHERTTLPCIQSAATVAEVDLVVALRASARTLRRRPASGRTRCRCGSSSRSGRRRDRRRAGSRSAAPASGRSARGACRRPASPPTIRQ